jgi:hypothetical protein
VFTKGNDQSFVVVVNAFLVLFLLSMAFGPSVRADSVTYSYVGNTFDSFRGSFACPPECKITGSFTLDQPLPPFFSASIRPTSFRFTDGMSTLTPTNTFHFVNCPVWKFSTDATGAITTWDICIIGRASVGLPFFSSANFVGVSRDGTNFLERDSASISDNPGTWSVSMASTPEPSCLMLLFVGLLAIVGGRRLLD